jgi:pimeloyl-ACP methyl ester carboxylesterase
MSKTIFKRMLTILLTTLVAGILIIGILLIIYSPGKTEPYLDESGNQIIGSISEKTFITINGVKQGMFIKSKNDTNPVLLFLHGGIPEYFLSKKYPTGLEDHFTVVWWEQRGSGLSNNSQISPATITLEQMVADAVDVTNYLRNRFNKNKIYLMAHSGGSYIGIQTALKAPELYYAYIGVSQISYQLKSEQLAHEYMLRHYKLSDNKEMVEKLRNAPVINDTPKEYLKLRDKAMHSLGIGTTHDMRSVPKEVFFRSLTCKEYTVKEKLNMWVGKSQAGVHWLWPEILSTNLVIQVPQLDIPTYFFGGVYDYTVSYTLAKEYLEKLQAPVKGFYTFKNSAHTPIFEEPQRVNEIILKDVLNGTALLADSTTATKMPIL